jgi:uncharacterized protein YbaR (Trm112 family)
MDHMRLQRKEKEINNEAKKQVYPVRIQGIPISFTCIRKQHDEEES